MRDHTHNLIIHRTQLLRQLLRRQNQAILLTEQNHFIPDFGSFYILQTDHALIHADPAYHRNPLAPDQSISLACKHPGESVRIAYG
ncbi:hypothetical protein D3C76_1696010 [compost metagenome]